MNLLRTVKFSPARTFIASLLIVCLVATASPFSGAQISEHSIAWPAELENLSIPPELGRISERFTGYAGKAVIFIQDAHAHYEAQKNISNILKLLAEKHRLDFIGVEGLEGREDFSLLRSFPQADARDKVLDQAMREGGTTGVEYFAMTGEKPARVVGVDDEELYIRNIQQYAELVGNRKEFDKAFGGIKQAVQNLAASVYSDKIKEINRITEKYNRNTTDLFSLLRVLRKFSFVIPAKAGIQLGPRLRGGDSGTSPRNDVGGLSNLTRVFAVLDSKSEISDEDLKKEWQDVNVVDLWNEVETLIDRLKEKFSETAAEREMLAIDKYVKLLERGRSLELSRDEVEKFSALRSMIGSDFISTLVKLAREKRVKISPFSDATVEEARRIASAILEFYDVAHDRDRGFAEKLKTEMRRKNSSVAALVTGGFHSEGILKQLKKQKISYIVIAPTMTEFPKENLYAKLMLDFGVPLMPAALNPNTQSARLPTMYAALPVFRKAIRGEYEIDEAPMLNFWERQRQYRDGLSRQMAANAGSPDIIQTWLRMFQQESGGNAIVLKGKNGFFAESAPDAHRAIRYLKNSKNSADISRGVIETGNMIPLGSGFGAAGTQIEKEKSDWSNKEWADREVTKRLKTLGERLEMNWLTQLIENYEQLLSRDPKDWDKSRARELRQTVSRIRSTFFRAANLLPALNKSKSPHYQGSHITALRSAFSGLGVAAEDFSWERLSGQKFSWQNSLAAEMEIRKRFRNSDIDWLSRLIGGYEKYKSTPDEERKKAEKERLSALAYRIEFDHILVSNLLTTLNVKQVPNFQGDFRNVVIAAFPLLQLASGGFNHAKEIAGGDLYRAVYKIEGGKRNLIHYNAKKPKTLYWDFLESGSPHVLRTYLDSHARVYVLPGGRRLEAAGSSISREDRAELGKIDERYKNAPVEIEYDLSGNPIELKVFDKSNPTVLVTDPIKLNPIEAYPRAGEKHPHDVYVSSYPSEWRKEHLMSHVVRGRLSKYGVFSFANERGARVDWGRFGARADGTVNPIFRNAPYIAYFRNGLPWWIEIYSKKDERKIVYRNIFSRALNPESLAAVRTFPFMLSEETWKTILTEREEILLEGTFISDSRGVVQIAGRRFTLPQAKETPLMVKWTATGEYFALPLTQGVNGGKAWDLYFFEKQIEDWAKPYMSPPPSGYDMILPKGLANHTREMYRRLYYQQRLSQPGVEKLFDQFIYVGDIAFENLFRDLGPEILERKIGSGKYIEERIDTILTNAIRQGYTVIDERSVGREAMSLIGKPIDLTERFRVGLIPLILRAEAARDLISKSHIYLVFHVMAHKRIQRLRGDIWEEIFAQAVGKTLRGAVRGYETGHKGGTSEQSKPVLFANTYLWKAVSREINAAKRKQMKQMTGSRGAYLQSLDAPMQSSGSKGGTWTRLEEVAETRSTTEEDAGSGALIYSDLAAAERKFTAILRLDQRIVPGDIEILWLRFLNKLGIEKWSLDKIGAKFGGVTGEAIRKHEERVLSQLMVNPQLLKRIGREILGLELDDARILRMLVDLEEQNGNSDTKKETSFAAPAGFGAIEVQHGERGEGERHFEKAIALAEGAKGEFHGQLKSAFRGGAFRGYTVLEFVDQDGDIGFYLDFENGILTVDSKEKISAENKFEKKDLPLLLGDKPIYKFAQPGAAFAYDDVFVRVSETERVPILKFIDQTITNTPALSVEAKVLYRKNIKDLRSVFDSMETEMALEEKDGIARSVVIEPYERRVRFGFYKGARGLELETENTVNIPEESEEQVRVHTHPEGSLLSPVDAEDWNGKTPLGVSTKLAENVFHTGFFYPKHAGAREAALQKLDKEGMEAWYDRTIPEEYFYMRDLILREVGDENADDEKVIQKLKWNIESFHREAHERFTKLLVTEWHAQNPDADVKKLEEQAANLFEAVVLRLAVDTGDEMRFARRMSRDIAAATVASVAVDRLIVMRRLKTQPSIAAALTELKKHLVSEETLREMARRAAQHARQADPRLRAPESYERLMVTLVGESAQDEIRMIDYLLNAIENGSRTDREIYNWYFAARLFSSQFLLGRAKQLLRISSYEDRVKVALARFDKDVLDDVSVTRPRYEPVEQFSPEILRRYAPQNDTKNVILSEAKNLDLKSRLLNALEEIKGHAENVRVVREGEPLTEAIEILYGKDAHPKTIEKESLDAIGSHLIEIHRDILPQLKPQDYEARILRTAEDWVGWHLLGRIRPDEAWQRHVQNIVGLGFKNAAVILLGMMGPHLRQLSDPADYAVYPLLMSVLLPELKTATEKYRGETDSKRKKALKNKAELLAAVLFNALHVNPHHVFSLHIAKEMDEAGRPFNIETYDQFFQGLMDALEFQYGIDDPQKIIAETVNAFPELLLSDDGSLPLYLQFSDREPQYAGQTGQDIVTLFAEFLEKKSRSGAPKPFPNIRHLLRGADPTVEEFLRERNHVIPKSQLDFLTAVRARLLSGKLFEQGVIASPEGAKQSQSGSEIASSALPPRNDGLVRPMSKEFQNMTYDLEDDNLFQASLLTNEILERIKEEFRTPGELKRRGLGDFAHFLGMKEIVSPHFREYRKAQPIIHFPVELWGKINIPGISAPALYYDPASMESLAKDKGIRLSFVDFFREYLSARFYDLDLMDEFSDATFRISQGFYFHKKIMDAEMEFLKWLGADQIELFQKNKEIEFRDKKPYGYARRLRDPTPAELNVFEDMWAGIITKLKAMREPSVARDPIAELAADAGLDLTDENELAPEETELSDFMEGLPFDPEDIGLIVRPSPVRRPDPNLSRAEKQKQENELWAHFDMWARFQKFRQKDLKHIYAAIVDSGVEGRIAGHLENEFKPGRMFVQKVPSGEPDGLVDAVLFATSKVGKVYHFLILYPNGDLNEFQVISFSHWSAVRVMEPEEIEANLRKDNIGSNRAFTIVRAAMRILKNPSPPQIPPRFGESATGFGAVGKVATNNFSYLVSQSSRWPKLRFFSTNQADYVFYPAVHFAETRIPEEVIEQIDTVVVETMALYEYLSQMVATFQNKQSAHLFQQIKKNKKPVFFVNVPYERFLGDRILDHLLAAHPDLSILLTLALIPVIVVHYFVSLWSLMSLVLWFPGLSFIWSVTISWNKKMAEIANYLSLSRFYSSISAFQSAVAARKLEEFIASSVERRLHRKPIILIEFGRAHYDIKMYAAHKWLRDLVIRFHKLLPNIFWRRDYFGKVGELNFLGVVGYQAAFHSLRDEKESASAGFGIAKAGMAGFTSGAVSAYFSTAQKATRNLPEKQVQKSVLRRALTQSPFGGFGGIRIQPVTKITDTANNNTRRADTEELANQEDANPAAVVMTATVKKELPILSLRYGSNTLLPLSEGVKIAVELFVREDKLTSISSLVNNILSKQKFPSRGKSSGFGAERQRFRILNVAGFFAYILINNIFTVSMFLLGGLIYFAPILNYPAYILLGGGITVFAWLAARVLTTILHVAGSFNWDKALGISEREAGSKAAAALRQIIFSAERTNDKLIKKGLTLVHPLQPIRMVANELYAEVVNGGKRFEFDARGDVARQILLAPSFTISAQALRYLIVRRGGIGVTYDQKLSDESLRLYETTPFDMEKYRSEWIPVEAAKTEFWKIYGDYELFKRSIRYNYPIVIPYILLHSMMFNSLAILETLSFFTSRIFRSSTNRFLPGFLRLTRWLVWNSAAIQNAGRAAEMSEFDSALEPSGKLTPSGFGAAEVGEEASGAKEVREGDFVALRYNAKAGRWQRTTSGLENVKKPYGRRLTVSQKRWINQAIQALPAKDRKTFQADPKTKIYFIKNYDQMVPQADNQTIFGSHRGFRVSASVPTYFFDLTMIDEPLELVSYLFYANRLREKILQQLSPEEQAKLGSEEGIFEVRRKVEEISRKARKELLSNFDPLQMGQVYIPYARIPLFKITILGIARKILKTKIRSLSKALDALKEASSDGNNPMHGSVMRALQLYAPDLLMATAWSRKDPEVRERVLSLLAQSLRDGNQAIYSVVASILIKNLSKTVLGEKNGASLKTASLDVIASILEMSRPVKPEKRDHIFQTIYEETGEILPWLKKAVEEEKNPGLRAQAAFTLAQAQRLGFELGVSSEMLKELKPVFEKWLGEYENPALVKSAIFALEALTGTGDLSDEEFEHLISGYIFGVSETNGLKRTEMYWSGNSATKTEIEKSMPTFARILSNDQYLSRFLTFLSVLRIGYHFSAFNNHFQAPLKSAVEEIEPSLRLGELYIAPLSGSFRRHIIYTEGGKNAVEIKFPGERSSSGDVLKVHVTLAEKLRRAYPTNPGVPKPLFYMGLKGEFNLYRPLAPPVVYKEFPLGVVGFQYEDGHRLSHVLRNQDRWETFLREVTGEENPSKEEAVKRFTQIGSDVLAFALRIHRFGYQATRVGEGHSLTDLHLENFRLLPNGRAESVADFGIFSKTSGAQDKTGIRIHETESLIISLVQYAGHLNILDDADLAFYLSAVTAKALETLVEDVKDDLERTRIIEEAQKELQPILKEREDLLLAKELGFEMYGDKGRIKYAKDFKPLDLKFDFRIVPHGVTDMNVQNLFQGGASDGPLNELNGEGHRQSEEGAAILWNQIGGRLSAGEEIVFLKTPRKRTKQTGEHFVEYAKARGVNINLEDEPAALEMFLDEWHAKADGDAYMNFNALVRPVSGESYLRFLKRVKEFVEYMNGKYKGKTVVLYGHRTFATALRILLEKPANEFTQPFIRWRDLVPNSERGKPIHFPPSSAGFGAAAVMLYSKLKLLEQIAPAEKLSEYRDRARMESATVEEIRQKLERQDFSDRLTTGEREFLKSFVTPEFYLKNSRREILPVIGFDRGPFLKLLLFYLEDETIIPKIYRMLGILRPGSVLAEKLMINSLPQLAEELNIGLKFYVHQLFPGLVSDPRALEKSNPRDIKRAILAARNLKMPGRDFLIEDYIVEMFNPPESAFEDYPLFNLAAQIFGREYRILIAGTMERSLDAFEHVKGHIEWWTTLTLGTEPTIVAFIPFDEYRELTALDDLKHAYEERGLSGGAEQAGKTEQPIETYSVLAPDLRSKIREAVSALGNEKNILSIGPGEGLLEQELASDGHRISAIELVDSFAENLRTRHGFTVYAGDAQKIDEILPSEISVDPNKKFDVVILPESIGYLIGPDFLKKLRPFVKNDARILVLTYPPLTNHIVWQYRLISAEKLTQWLSDAGFETVSTKFYRIAGKDKSHLLAEEVAEEKLSDVYLLTAAPAAGFGGEKISGEGGVSGIDRLRIAQESLSKEPSTRWSWLKTWFYLFSFIVGYINHPIIKIKKDPSNINILGNALKLTKNWLASAAATMILNTSNSVFDTISFLFGSKTSMGKTPLKDFEGGQDYTTKEILSQHIIAKRSNTQGAGFGAASKRDLAAEDPEVFKQIALAQKPLENAMRRLRQGGFADVAEMVRVIFPRAVHRYYWKSQRASAIHHIAYVLDFMSEIMIGEHANKSEVKRGMTAALLHDVGIGETSVEKVSKADLDESIRNDKAHLDALQLPPAQYKKLLRRAIRKHIGGAILFRETHMRKGSSIAMNLMYEYNNDAGFPFFSEDDIKEAGRLVEIHDNPSIQAYEELRSAFYREFGLDKTETRQHKLFAKDDRLMMFLREADRLWTITEDGIEFDLWRKKSGGDALMRAANNVKRYREEAELYLKEFSYKAKEYRFINGLLFRTETGYSIFKRLVKILLDKYKPTNGNPLAEVLTSFSKPHPLSFAPVSFVDAPKPARPAVEYVEFQAPFGSATHRFVKTGLDQIRDFIAAHSNEPKLILIGEKEDAGKSTFLEYIESKKFEGVNVDSDFLVYGDALATAFLPGTEGSVLPNDLSLPGKEDIRKSAQILLESFKARKQRKTSKYHWLISLLASQAAKLFDKQQNPTQILILEYAGILEGMKKTMPFAHPSGLDQPVHVLMVDFDHGDMKIEEQIWNPAGFGIENKMKSRSNLGNRVIEELIKNDIVGALTPLKDRPEFMAEVLHRAGMSADDLHGLIEAEKARILNRIEALDLNTLVITGDQFEDWKDETALLLQSMNNAELRPYIVSKFSQVLGLFGDAAPSETKKMADELRQLLKIPNHRAVVISDYSANLEQLHLQKVIPLKLDVTRILLVGEMPPNLEIALGSNAHSVASAELTSLLDRFMQLESIAQSFAVAA